MRRIDKMIQTHLFGNEEFEVFDGTDYVKVGKMLMPLPEYSTNPADAFLVLEKLSESTMNMFSYSFFGGTHRFDIEHLDSHGKHEVYSAAVCLAALNSINFDGRLTEEIRDAVFSFNYSRGVL